MLSPVPPRQEEGLEWQESWWVEGSEEEEEGDGKGKEREKMESPSVTVQGEGELGSF